jgi:hypothetical protein
MVFNTTRKAPKVCPKTGRDLRSNEERVGYNISFRDEMDTSQVVAPGQPPRFTSRIDQGLVNLVKSGAIEIKKMNDITDAMDAHVAAPARAPRPKATASPNVAPATSTGQMNLFDAPDRSARVTETGKENHAARGGREHESAVNPDGEPNFLVKTKEVTRKRRGKGAGADAG